MEKKYVIVNYKEQYGSIMQFGKNKNEYIHRWYPFVEGYSKEFILKILKEYKDLKGCYPHICLEPFTGSGTTPLELQRVGIKCYSFEVSPFMYDLACTKMVTNYTLKSFQKYFEAVSSNLCNCNFKYGNEDLYKNFNTIVEKDNLEKWNFNKEVIYGILDIRNAIESIKNRKYRRLFTIALASILLEVSNVYRNGKCVSYKTNWKEQVTYSRQQVHNVFLDKLNTVFREDIIKMQEEKKTNKISNERNCFLGDSRKLVFDKLIDDSVDLVITSPPYLNSRDYTDTYMVELRVLGFLKDTEDVRKLRRKTIRSHVQVKWGETDELNIQLLNEEIAQISKHAEEFWNSELLNMIKGYFIDMNILFEGLYRKMNIGGMIFFNVANSAYYNVEIKVDEIICEIAESKGFKVKEIREARRIKPSSQQKDSIESLRESVIVLTK